MNEPTSPDSEPRRVDAEGLQRILAGIERQKAAGRNADAAIQPEPLAAILPPHTPAPAHVPGGKRNQVPAASSVIEAKPISYYSPELIQCTLPHSEPKYTEDKDENGKVKRDAHGNIKMRRVKEGEKVRDWIRKNGKAGLTITSGVDDEGQIIGIPYGSFPRLVLAYIITSVIATRERRVELSSYWGSFLKEVGYVGDIRGNNPSARRLHDQMMRLLHAHIKFHYGEGDKDQGRARIKQMDVAPEFDLWWNFKAPEQDSLFGSWLEISENFYNAILAAPMPLRTDILKELKKSPLAIDVYMWLSYRLFSMHTTGQRELFIPYSALQLQFGTSFAEENYRKFRQELKLAFGKVAALWHHDSGSQPDRTLLQYGFTDAGGTNEAQSGLYLYFSPLLIGRGERLTGQQEARAILEGRSFDRETLIKARRYSGKWSIDRLQADYFQWVEENEITVNDPRAHFLDFVKQHTKRNP